MLYGIDKTKPFIFTLTDGDTVKTSYMIKYPEEGNAKRISKSKWFELYDEGYQVAPPLTI